MDTPSQNNRSVFDISDEEMQQRMADRLELLKQELFSKDLPITYSNENCISEDLFVH